MPPCKLVVVRAGRGASCTRHHPYKLHRGPCTRARLQPIASSQSPSGTRVEASAPAAAAGGRDEDRGQAPAAATPGGGGRLLATPALVGGKYLLLGQAEGSTLYRCVHVHTRREFVAKVLSPEAGRVMVRAHLRMSGHPHVSPLAEVLWTGGDPRSRVCLLLPPAPGGDLHSHVRARRRLKESEARRLFRQMAAAVRDCHSRGLVLRDLKLRKFVFADAHRTHLRLESLEDAVVIGSGEPASLPSSRGDAFQDYSPAFPSSYSAWPTSDDPSTSGSTPLDGSGGAAPRDGGAADDDRLEEKRGCPAYVSPEILRSGEKYSGRAADMWSLGVVLYTMLVGRYPFNDSEHASLFAKISRARFGLPETVSPRARCLVRSLLRREPAERLSATDVLLHPWLAPSVDGRARDEDVDEEGEEGAEGGKAVRGRSPRQGREQSQRGDQAVPEWDYSCCPP